MSAGEVLCIEDATIPAEGASATSIWGANLRLGPGELALVNLVSKVGSLPLADACVGLREPAKGCVRFLGEDWRSIPPARADELRGLIGRVFEGQAWVHHRDVGYNIMLPQLHHSDRPAQAIREEAHQLARAFGLPGLPSGPVHAMLAADLQRAACARAFMGSPRLLLLENPTEGVFPGIMSPLLNLLRRRREQGAAVLWLTRDDRIWREQALRPTHRFQMAGSQLVDV